MKRNQAGYTMLEVLIATTILITILGAGLVAVRSSQRSFQETVSSGVLNQRTNRALNRLAQSLASAGGGSVVISPQREVVSFQRLTGYAAGVPTWSNTHELRLRYEPTEVDNGLDDDGDGFIDECQVVFTENLGQADEKTVVLANGVREFLEGELPDGLDNNENLLDDERGLCFEFQDSTLIIRLTLLRRLPEGGTGLHTLSTSVGFRN